MRAGVLGREQHGFFCSQRSAFEAQITTGMSSTLRFRIPDGQYSHIADKTLQRPKMHYQLLHPKGKTAFALLPWNLSHIALVGFRRQMEKQRPWSLSLEVCTCASRNLLYGEALIPGLKSRCTCHHVLPCPEPTFPMMPSLLPASPSLLLGPQGGLDTLLPLPPWGKTPSSSGQYISFFSVPTEGENHQYPRHTSPP